MEIIKTVKKDALLSRVFYGVFPIDKLPNIEIPGCIIVNTDTSDGPGEHWVACFVNSNGIGEFFDSYGKRLVYPRIKKFFDNHCLRVNTNTTQLQQNYSTICGEYCLFYLALKARQRDINKIIGKFSRNLQKNDLIVMGFMKHHFRHTAVLTDIPFLCDQISQKMS